MFVGRVADIYIVVGMEDYRRGRHGFSETLILDAFDGYMVLCHPEVLDTPAPVGYSRAMQHQMEADE